MRPTHVLLIEILYLAEDERWLINSYEFVRQITIFDNPRTILSIIFLLCLHSCVSNSNKNNNTNNYHSQLVTRRIENLNVNDCHLSQGD